MNPKSPRDKSSSSIDMDMEEVSNQINEIERQRERVHSQFQPLDHQSQMRVRIDSQSFSKVPWGQDHLDTRMQSSGDYFQMSNQDYQRFHNSGDRVPTNQHMLKPTGKMYSYDEGTQQFHQYQPNNTGQMGEFVGNKDNEILQGYRKQGLFLDLSREDRRKDSLQGFDIGTYNRDASYGGIQFPTLPKAKGAWPANNDHNPSGKSLKLSNQNNSQEAYDKGLTMAINNPDMHRGSYGSSFSDTYGGRQSTQDTDVDGSKAQRSTLDAQNRARAFERSMHSLDQGVIQQKDFSQGSAQMSEFNFQKPENQLSYFGAQNNLAQGNVMANQQNPGFGFNPSTPKQTFTFNSQDNSYRYASGGQGTQGESIQQRLTSNIQSNAKVTNPYIKSSDQ